MRERRLVWIDLEMTGLHPDEGDCIIEIATIVTEADLSIVAEAVSYTHLTLPTS